MGNPFLFADRFSGAVVHLTTGRASGVERDLTIIANAIQIPTSNTISLNTSIMVIALS
jgi:ethanolamine utilization microcompartment shell protein EutS